MVQCLAHVLVGDDCLQCQMMEGHPWSAGKSGSVTFFTEIHTRYNSEKLLCLIEEAWRPENAGKVFLACLTRISPAELLEFFTEIAIQLRYGNIMGFGDVHFSEPVPFPPNLFLIGTMDITRFVWWDSDLLSSTTVIHWPEESIGRLLCPVNAVSFPAAEKSFLGSYVRNEQAVYKKLHTLLGWQRQPVLPFFLISSLLEKEGIPLPRTLVKEGMIYLANSWSAQGSGLFHPSPTENLATALDLAIAQTYLMRAGQWIQRSKPLQIKLEELLDEKFPRSAAIMAALAG